MTIFFHFFLIHLSLSTFTRLRLMRSSSCCSSFDLNVKVSDDGDPYLLDFNIEAMVALGDEERSHPSPLINLNVEALGVEKPSHLSPLISLNVEALGVEGSSHLSPLINLNVEAMGDEGFCYACPCFI